MGITLDKIDSGLHSIVVTATDLDIRDLAFASDSVTAHQGGTWTVDSITNDVNVTATDLDIRDLAFASDSVTSHQGGTWIIDSITNPVDVDATLVMPTRNTSWVTKTVTVGDTAVQIDATPLADREAVLIQNIGNQDVFVGPANTVTTANGILIPKGSSYVKEDWGVNLQIWGITASGTSDVRLEESK